MKIKKSLKNSVPLGDVAEGIQRSIAAYKAPPPHPLSINEIVSKSQNKSGINRINEQLKNKDDIKNQCIRCIPKEFKKQISDISLVNNLVTIYVNHAAIATRLKFQKMDILENLRKSGWYSLVSIKIQVNPAQ